MNRGDLVKRVRSLTRDLSSSIFRAIDITDYINEGIDRFRQFVPQLKGMAYLNSDELEPALLPSEYHHLLALYSASRCFGQDERNYQATTFMNEFEAKLDELKVHIEEGSITIADATGTPVDVSPNTDYVVNDYFTRRDYVDDEDEGVN